MLECDASGPAWLHPVLAEPLSKANPEAPPLPTVAAQSWARRGFALVDGLLPISVLQRCRRECFPPDADDAQPVGNFGAFVFPCEEPAVVNEVSLHPRLIAAAEQLLGTSDVRLSQADIWKKRSVSTPWSAFDNQDQRIHMDYPNHSLVHPPPWHEPEAVAMIVYLDGVEECGGATAVVPRTGPDDEAYRWPLTGMPGVGSVPWINDRTQAERYVEEHQPELARRRSELYRREMLCRYHFGTVLLYRHDVWHRGTPLLEGRTRVVMNLVFKRPGLDWFTFWQEGWARGSYYPSRYLPVSSVGAPRFSAFARLLATCTVQQRSCLGFPAPGHSYWTEETLAAVASRFGPLGFDVSPYADAFQRRRQEGGEHSSSKEVLALKTEISRLRALL